MSTPLRLDNYTAYPYSYAPLDYEWSLNNNATDIIYVHKNEFERIADLMNEDGDGMILSLACETGERVVRVGGYHFEEQDIIYVPEWIAAIGEGKTKK